MSPAPISKRPFEGHTPHEDNIVGWADLANATVAVPPNPMPKSCRRGLAVLVYLLSCGSARSLTTNFPLNLNAAARLLEVTLPSAKGTVRAAYRKKATIVHPDVNKHPNAAADFLRITAAYEVLLQFSFAAPPPRTAAPPRGAGTASTAAPPRHEDVFTRRVNAWREYWQVTLQATQLSVEAERKTAQQNVLAVELERLRSQLQAVQLQSHSKTVVDGCRARYAKVASEHADVACAVRTLRGRVVVMQKEAKRLEALAQEVAA